MCFPIQDSVYSSSLLEDQALKQLDGYHFCGTFLFRTWSTFFSLEDQVLKFLCLGSTCSCQCKMPLDPESSEHSTQQKLHSKQQQGSPGSPCAVPHASKHSTQQKLHSMQQRCPAGPRGAPCVAENFIEIGT